MQSPERLVDKGINPIYQTFNPTMNFNNMIFTEMNNNRSKKSILEVVNEKKGIVNYISPKQ